MDKNIILRMPTKGIHSIRSEVMLCGAFEIFQIQDTAGMLRSFSVGFEIHLAHLCGCVLTRVAESSRKESDS